VPSITRATDRFVIVDDFLPQAAVDALLQHVNDDRFSDMHAHGWAKPWRLGDGRPIHGTEALVPARGKRRTGTALDLFVDAIFKVLPDVEKTIGLKRSAWTAMSIAPMIYPAGTALSLHRDSIRHAGAYTYFLHRQWNFHWGGHLLILDGVGDAPRRSTYPHFLSDEEENRLVSEPGLATCILPKPNRIVFLAPSAFHMITRVDPNAGNHARIALSGFFRRPE
jgi:hypothetical protein